MQKNACACKRCLDRIKRGMLPAHRSAEGAAQVAALRGKPKQEFTKELPEGTRYAITWAQNATPVHTRFWKTLLKYCEKQDARLIVIPGRYKNPTSHWSIQAKGDEWWAKDVIPYLFDGRAALGENFSVFGDVSIQPTATHPLSGFEVFATTSAVFGHPKLQLKTVPASERRYPRIFTTTGACTKPNYISSRAGKTSAGHHVFGACVVELSASGLFHIRQINAKRDGSFIDLDREYTPDSVHKAPRSLGLVLGDVHKEHVDAGVVNATFIAPDAMCRVLKPRHVVYHDFLDFDVRNHHTRGDFYDRFDRITGKKRDSVRAELFDAVQAIDAWTPKDAHAIVVRSNHDEAFERWLKEADAFADPVNAPFWFETWHKLCKNREKYGSWQNAFALWYGEWSKTGGARFLARDESFRLADIECGFHSDLGPDGSRGSALSFSKIGKKTIIGHGHGPKITGGCYQAGVCSLDQEYNHVPSSWLTTHVSVYGNGKRTLLTIIGEGEGAEWKA